jgi:putative ABC transport system permease protein
MIRRLAALGRSLLRRGAVEREMDEEMHFHLEMEIRKLQERGLDAESARTEALRDFGGVDKHKEEGREVRGLARFEAVSQDVRYALRGLRRNPGYAAAALATLALGIGANVAVFSVVHGVFLQSLPYDGGERLVRLRQDAPGIGIENAPFSPKEVSDYAAQTRTLTGVAEYHSMWFILLREPEPERVQTGVVAANFFDLVGVKPLLGRTFLPGEDAPGSAPSLVLSYDYWQRSHGGDPKIVGRTFKMNDRIHVVIGVLPPISACPFRGSAAMANDRTMRMVTLFGRMKPGVTLSAVQADLGTIAGRLARQYPEAYPPKEARFTALAVPLRQELTERARPTFLVLLATVGLVLLLACANVANLTLARQLRRQREMALRAALGAGRARLARQMLTESVVLSLSGGLLGVLLAKGTLGLLVSFAARFTPRANEIRIDMPVLLFALGISIATGIVFGLIPSFSPRRNLVGALQEGGERSGGGAGRHRLRSALIVVQVAISFMLLIGAGLMLRSLWRLQQVDLGFQTERVLTTRLDLNFTKYRDAEMRRAFQLRLLERLAGQPGVVSSAIAGTFPLNDGGPQSGQFEIEGSPVSNADLRPQADFQNVSTDYFQTIRIPVLRGRGLAASDRANTPPVAVINQTMAQHLWASQDPIGRRLSVDRGQQWIQIVGVVGDVRQYGLDRRPPDQVYLAQAQFPPLSSTLLLRSAADPLSLSRLVRSVVHGLDPEQAVDRFRTLEQVHANALASPRLTFILLGIFAVLALLVTSAGIAGVVAFTVGERTSEFGIRLALGADPREVVGMVLRQAMTPVVIGLALGFAGAHLLATAMSRLLFEVNATDPPTFLAMSAVLAAVALAASFLPARRITGLDPMIALRSA